MSYVIMLDRYEALEFLNDNMHNYDTISLTYNEQVKLWRVELKQGEACQPNRRKVGPLRLDE